MMYMTHNIKNKQSAGFTLIELSIVLVIIGLIAGGVLVGQDLIHAAEIRATVTQVEQYKSATNTFRNKYNALPGDIANPQNFGFASTNSSSSTLGAGNNDGLIESTCQNTSGPSVYVASQAGGETILYWTHLQQAGLIEALTTPITDYACSGSPGLTAEGLLPDAKIGKKNYFLVGAYNGLNYFMLANVTSGWTAVSGTYDNSQRTITPVEAFQIDTKLDDGSPIAGTVSALFGEYPANSAVNSGNGGVNYCYTAAGNYNIVTSASVGCNLLIRAGF